MAISDMNSTARLHSLIAHSISATTHVGLMLMACFVGAPQMLWQTDVSRGRPAIVILSLESPDSVAQPFTEIQPITTELKIEPIDSDDLPLRRYADSANPNVAEFPTLFEERLLTTNARLSATTSMQREIPEVTEPVMEPRKKRPFVMQAVASTASPPPVAAPSGANFDSPPSKLPENQPPIYPSDARAAGHQGRVILVVSVNSDGSVTDIAIATSSGFGSLDAAAIEAVHQWRFSPATLKGDAVKAEILVPVRFTISASS